MADLPSPGRDEDNFLENGRLSYENPNYKLHFDPLRLDVLNSNTDHYNINTTLLGYDMDMQLLTPQLSNMDLGLELEMALRQRGAVETNATRQRRNYATLDPASMGVDLDVGPVMNLGSPDFDNNRGVGKTTDETSALLSNSAFEGGTGVNRDNSSPVSETSSLLQQTSEENEASADNGTDDESLPLGWEKHEDDEGPYYWHIKSGTIQREPPPRPAKDESRNGRNFQKQVIREAEALTNSTTSIPSVVTRSSTSFTLSDLEAARAKEETAYKRRSYPVLLNSEPKDKAIRFAVRSLGWVEIAEEDLTPERSSKAVNRCIVDLSLGRNDLLDVVGRWGDGKDLFMDLDEGSLKLIDPENLTVLNSQPIHTIRVWGVGRDNGRDFAYVARDRVSRRHMCHVFRCDTPARTIANTLRDICKKIMIERSLQHSSGKPVDPGLSPTSSTARTRPTNLPTEQRRPTSKIGTVLSQNFPTPMEEPRKVLKGRYVGSLKVSRPSGMDVLNDAIDQLVNQTPQDQWREVNISIAPSVIVIVDTEDEENILAECRVRFLSFLGIGRQVEHCGFIVHTANDVFVAHIMCCEPSSGAICKTIEAACKLRYQKCLDAHGVMRGRAPPLSETQTPTGRSLEGIGAALKSVLGSLTGKKGSRNPDS